MSTDLLAAIGSIATAAGVFTALWQLCLAHKQSKTAFEDSFAREYREIVSTIPTKAMLGETLEDKEHCDALDEFYRYFDLSNEQAFLYERGRIRDDTWEEWKAGMLTNLKRPAFKRAWDMVSRKAVNDFSELRAVIREAENSKPKNDVKK